MTNLHLAFFHQILRCVGQQDKIDRVQNWNEYEYEWEMMVFNERTQNIRSEHACISA